RVEAVAYTSGADLPAVGEASAWIIRPADLPRWAPAGKLAAAPAEYRAAGGEYGWNGLLSLYRDKLLTWAGEAYGLPLLGEAPLCFYRADLWADAKHRQAFREHYQRELGPPRTWEEFADIADYFYRNREPGRTAPSLPPLPESGEELDFLFHAVAAPHARRAVFQEEGRRATDEELFS